MTSTDDMFGPDDELDALGTAMQAHCMDHPGDLAELLRRSRSRHTRRRLTQVAVVSAALLIAVVTVGARRTENRATDVRVGGLDATSAPTSSATQGATATPMWTVNNSVVLRHGVDTWAIEIVFDPAVWSFDRFSHETYLAQSPDSPGMASYKTEPKLEVYWEGNHAQASALAAQAALQGQPGIISIEVGPAIETAHPIPPSSGTAPPGSVTPTPETLLH